MVKPLILSLFSVLFLSACKREYALVQPTSVDSFLQKQRVKPAEITTVKPTETTTKVEAQQTKNPNLDSETTNIFELKDELILETTAETSEQSVNSTKINRPLNLVDLATPSTFSSFSKQLGKTQKRPVKQKKKPLRRWNAMIPAGFIFLGIAILLTLINLNGLALLFGVASILFLFLGFKKLFRRNKRRSIFR